MSWSLVQDNQSKHASRVTEVFGGMHGGFGRTDAPKRFANACADLEFSRGDARMRPGMRRNEASGYSGTVGGVFRARLGGVHLAGIVHGGSLDLVLVSDLLTGGM